MTRKPFREGVAPENPENLTPNAKTIFSKDLAKDIHVRGIEPKGVVFPEKDFTAMKQEIFQLLEEHEHKQKNPYHNADHTMDTLARVRALLAHNNVSPEDSQVAEIAALFHDYGHPGKFRDEPDGLSNEEFAAIAADQFAKGKEFSVRQRILLQGMILGTNVTRDNVGPRTDLERVVALADGGGYIQSWNGWVQERAQLLRERQKTYSERMPIDIDGWLNKLLKQLAWAEQHIRQTSIISSREMERWLKRIEDQRAIIQNLLDHPERSSKEMDVVQKEIASLLQEALPSSVDLYVFRHGKTEYKEVDEAQKKKQWVPDMDDVTEKGKEKIRQEVAKILSTLDPKKHVIVFLSSPRARAMTTERVLEDVFTTNGFTIHRFGGDTAIVDMLRSGGDNSPLRGKQNEILLDPTTQAGVESHFDLDDRKKFEEARRRERFTGERFRQFLSYFAAIDQKRLAKASREQWGGKIPVFIAVTHVEVVQGHEAVAETSFGQSFFGKVFGDDLKFFEDKKHLRTGTFFKLSFDLKNPWQIRFRRDMKDGLLEAKLMYDQRTGNVEKVSS